MKRTQQILAGGQTHPWRQQLPVAALAVTVDKSEAEPSTRGENVRMFLLSFTAFFIAFSAFLL